MWGLVCGGGEDLLNMKAWVWGLVCWGGEDFLNIEGMGVRT